MYTWSDLLVVVIFLAIIFGDSLLFKKPRDRK
jgi:hypothetical protein